MDELRTTLTNDDGEEVPAIIRYEVEGYKRVRIVSIHADMPGELGPDIRQYFDDDEAVFCVCRSIEWKKPARDDYPFN